MFTNFNVWYLYVPAAIALTAFCGIACEGRPYAHFAKNLNAVIGGACLAYLLGMESIHGAMEVARWIIGPTADGLDLVVVAFCGIAVAGFLFGCVLLVTFEQAPRLHRRLTKKPASASVRKVVHGPAIDTTIIHADSQDSSTTSALVPVTPAPQPRKVMTLNAQEVADMLTISDKMSIGKSREWQIHCLIADQD